jgi:hypothetical protein
MKKRNTVITVIAVLVIAGSLFASRSYADNHGLYISGGQDSSLDQSGATLPDYFAAVGEDEQAAHCEILYFEGEVKICFADEVKCAPAQEGLYLTGGDKVEVGADSYIELAFDEAEENIVRIDSDTFVMIVLKEDEKIELLEGKVFAVIDNLPSDADFQIRTPTAVAGVRGTDWLVSVTEGVTEVEAFSGQPYVRGFSKDGKLRPEVVRIGAGQATTIKRFAAPQKLRAIPKNKINQWKNQKQVMLKNARATRVKRREVPGIQRRLQLKQDLKGPLKPRDGGSLDEEGFKKNNNSDKLKRGVRPGEQKIAPPIKNNVQPKPRAPLRLSPVR